MAYNCKICRIYYMYPLAMSKINVNKKNGTANKPGNYFILFVRGLFRFAYCFLCGLRLSNYFFIS